ncbi:F-box protein At3g07870-like [Papaver somniferum]|uniref:F-box protein At3g07870-like n=1 Tax=Papaver somniferum TaxID=3469 RepID=UPI000E70155A|nr:F-box protein At3g07870-like [Papaver somniferum]
MERRTLSVLLLLAKFQIKEIDVTVGIAGEPNLRLWCWRLICELMVMGGLGRRRYTLQMVVAEIFVTLVILKDMSVCSKRNTEVSRVEIYTLGSDSWKTSMSCIPYKLSGEEPGVFVNGALHWLANTFTSNNNYKPRVIVSFDLEEEIFKEIPLPEEVRMDDFDYRFVDVLRGCLCLLCSVSKVGFVIWEMKNYGVRKSWTKLYKTDPQLMMALDIPTYHYIRSAVFLQNGEILLQIRLHDGQRYSSSFEWQKRSTVVRICWEDIIIT